MISASESTTNEEKVEENNEEAEPKEDKSEKTEYLEIKANVANINEKSIITTTNIPVKGKLEKTIEERVNKVRVAVPVAIPKFLRLSSTSINEDEENNVIMVPAIEDKKIVTIEKTCPKKVQTVVTTELDPIVTVTKLKDRRITEVKIPIQKHTITTTTVKKTTLVTTETTTTIGKGEEKTSIILGKNEVRIPLVTKGDEEKKKKKGKCHR